MQVMYVMYVMYDMIVLYALYYFVWCAVMFLFCSGLLGYVVLCDVLLIYIIYFMSYKSIYICNGLQEHVLLC